MKSPTDDCLVAKHRHLNQAPAIIARASLPIHASMLCNGPKSLSGNYPFELLSFLSISRIEASLMNARALRVRFSKSLANRRHRLSQAKVRSTTQRLGRTSKPSAVSERLTISTANPGNSLASSARNFGSGNRRQQIAFSETGTARTELSEPVSRHRVPERRPDELPHASASPRYPPRYAASCR